MLNVPSPNFAFLAHHDARLVALGTQAEEHFATDANVTLYKLRQFCEVLAKRAAANVGLLLDPREDLRRVIDALWDRNVINTAQRDLFHQLRRAGNEAVHDLAGTQSQALYQLKLASQLAIWFQRAFGNNRKFDPGPFVPPAEPKKPDAALHDELARLRAHLGAHAKEAEDAKRAVEEIRKAAEDEQARRLTAEERGKKAREEAAIWEALAADQIESHRAAADAKRKTLEEQNQKLVAELAALQAAAAAAPAAQIEATVARAAKASDAIQLDEAATRKLIDAQLRAAGWEVDSERMTFDRGVRPVKSRNLAIAEWPTLSDGQPGRADYVLFAGLTAIGVVEAKKQHKDVAGVITQSKRYSRGYIVHGEEVLPAGSPWGGQYKVPFLFATNGRPFLRQLQTKSGIWFLDARRPDNLAVPLEGWCTPEGLLDRLKLDVDRAHAALEVEPMPYIEREFQRSAILAVEAALAKGQREILVAMATGTGKTRTCIGLCYRLLKTKRCRRVLFLVDRTALGEQTHNAFKELQLEQLKPFTDIFDVKGLGDMAPEPTTKLHIATVQALVRRMESDDDVPPVDQYDCVVVDECHRGYLLDRELSDREFRVRDEEDYISKYRRVLDHFDAVKIGLTATPALHTKEIFGAPVFQYSYREAVVDGYLVDHLPPIRIVTQLARDGIHYDAHEEVMVLDRATQSVKKWNLPDAVDFEVEHFNKHVIVEGFNRAVLAVLAKEIEPGQKEKTLIFCATDEHADLVVMLLKEALKAQWGSVEDDAVVKITGAADRPIELIRRYRNERFPQIAVTVDLLTTGIDIPAITNIVFLRRVRSRILYEQMLGRATRLCPEIGKERFRIFDAVDLYAAIMDVTDMKPVVVQPSVTFEALVKEILSDATPQDRQEAVEQLLTKLHRKKRALQGDHGERFDLAAGMSAHELAGFLKRTALDDVATWLAEHAQAIQLLDAPSIYPNVKTVVHPLSDSVIDVTYGYGKWKRPEDYLESFREFVAANLNTMPALLVVTQRPRDLTRADLKRLKLSLDQQGYTEAVLETAWHDTKNENIAATIIGYIRQLALGSPLVAYATRVDRAVQALHKKHKFTAPQAKWLGRIAEQLKAETVVDRESLDRDQWKQEGGYPRINKVFDGKLDALLHELVDEVWMDAG